MQKLERKQNYFGMGWSCGWREEDEFGEAWMQLNEFV